MSLPWSGQQVEWLQAMGLEVLQRPTLEGVLPGTSPSATLGAVDGIPAGLARAARGLDLAPLIAVAGIPRDVPSRRAFWHLLRPRRKAARAG